MPHSLLSGPLVRSAPGLPRCIALNRNIARPGTSVLPSTAAALAALRRRARGALPARVQVLVRLQRGQPQSAGADSQLAAQVTGSLHLVGDFLRILRPRH